MYVKDSKSRADVRLQSILTHSDLSLAFPALEVVEVETLFRLNLGEETLERLQVKTFLD